MRLIDADALLNMYKYYDSLDVEALKEDIDSLPTYERKHGEWKWKLAWNGWKDIYCSECRHTENVDMHVSLGWKYCPMCGAIMEDE